MSSRSGWREESAGFRRSGLGDALSAAGRNAAGRHAPDAEPSGGRPVSVPLPGRAIREVPLGERPRERLAARGAAGLTTAELIGLVWGSGTRGRSAVDVAGDALARHDGLTGLARATEVELAAVPGIGAARAAQLVAAFE